MEQQALANCCESGRMSGIAGSRAETCPAEDAAGLAADGVVSGDLAVPEGGLGFPPIG